VDYLGLARAALGVMPTQHEIVLERFFDESGGTQLVIHSPYGSRINKAWGLALRKRFCRKFNFELQAAATEDSIVLSLSNSHSFPLEEVSRYLNAKTVRDILIQAMLDAPLFTARWRWTATTALALPRFRGGKKVPPQLQRMMAEDLIAAVFPDQIACAENLSGEREIPEHPLVDQTIHDCLHEAMDIDGLERLLKAIEARDVQVVARDTTEPSPLASEVLNAAPYAYLDDAPLEERRTQAVQGRRWLDAGEASDLGRLDAAAIQKVREEAWPSLSNEATNADELHQVLMQLECLTQVEVRGNAEWPRLAAQLAAVRRAALVDGRLWIAAERLPMFQAIYPRMQLEPGITAPEEFARIPWVREDGITAVVRGRLSALGPVTANRLAQDLNLSPADIDMALAQLEAEGTVMRGRFTPASSGVTADAGELEWCERRLLARIHRYTVKRLRQEIEPVEPRDFMRFLFQWQRVAPGAQVEGEDALAAILGQLEGYEAPAAAWESEILPARVAGYDFTWLDDLCLAGRVVWTRLSAPTLNREREHAGGPVRSTPIALLQRRNMLLWTALAALHPRNGADALPLSPRATLLHAHLKEHGASFFDEMLAGTKLLRTQLEEGLGELVSLGLVNADSYTGLRALLLPASKRTLSKPRRGRRALYGIDDAGRWSLIRRPAADPDAAPARHVRAPQETVEHIAWTLLRRYGVVFWRLLEREAAWLPPWRELLRVYHRLEARGEIRGGRFVAGLSGEQFALPEAIGLLRKVRKQEAEGATVVVSGADPLNLVGSVLPGAKVPALTGSRILYRDGVPLATLVAGEAQFLQEIAEAEQWAAKKLLLRDAHYQSRPARTTGEKPSVS
jgi:ATP-dependent Lhr-like helicase